MIKGIAQVSHNLTKFQAGILGRAVRNTMLRAGTPLLQAAKAQAPKKSGALKKALRKRAWMNRNKARAGVIVSVSQTAKTKNPGTARDGTLPDPVFFIPRNYLHLVIYGTKPHAIGSGARLARVVTRMKKGKLTRSSISAKPLGKTHPGAVPNKFLSRAVAIAGSSCSALMRDGLTQSINAQIARLKAKGKIAP